MIKCFFNGDYKHAYSCEYEYIDDSVLLKVEYDIQSNEAEEVAPGIRIFTENNEFKNRDIVVLDISDNNYFLMKDARFVGYKSWDIFNSYETRFKSEFILINKEVNNLIDLDTKISKIKILSKTLNRVIGNPSLVEHYSNEELKITLNRNIKRNRLDINTNNIKSISLSDDWNHLHRFKEGTVNINVEGCIELDLINTIDYKDVLSYLNELMIYMQLYIPDSFVIDKVYVSINNIDYEFKCPFPSVKIRNTIEASVKVNILDFLGNCYKRIPYRNNDEIRNLFYILVRPSISLEDNFLMCYKFIDFYYGVRSVKHPIKESLINNYNGTIEDIDTYAQEIVDLRNHYVHDCYYIKDERIEVLDKRNKKVKKVIENVNTEWIFDRVKVLFKVCIDITFKNLLKYDDYRYKKEYL